MYKLLKSISLFSLFLLSLPSSAFAADAALMRIIGFSPDGKYFAFEQYGIQDGSGFPYVDIFFINSHANSWVKNAPPIRLIIKDDATSLSKARARAIAKATPKIKQLGTMLHGFTLVSKPITQLDGDKYSSQFGIHPSAPRLNQYELKLTTQTTNAPTCQQYIDQPIKIFSLSLTALKSHPPSKDKLIKTYTDTNLPKSRGCALDYTIDQVHYFEADNGDKIFMTFINIMKLGFEGQDRRYMVIPFVIKK